MTRRQMHSVGRALAQSLKPNWGVEGPFQWGTVQAVVAGSPIATVSVYLDNSSSGTGATITAKVPFLNGYLPTVGDVVLIARMAGAARTQRVVIGCLSQALRGFTSNGVMDVNGTLSGLEFDDRTGTAPAAWMLYASGGIARLWNNVNNDRLQVSDGTLPARTILDSPSANLQLGGTGSAWEFSKYRCRVYLNGNVSRAFDTTTKVPFNAADFDPNSNFDLVTNHRYTAPLAGYYLITFGYAESFGSQTGFFGANIQKNGVNVPGTNGGDVQISNGSWPSGVNGSSILKLAAADYIELFASGQSTVGATTMVGDGGVNTCNMCVTFLGT